MSAETLARAADERVDWIGSVPFFLIHLTPLLAIWTGVRTVDVILCAALYFGRMFFISAGYHRYFAHRGYKTSRWMQFLLAFGGATATQKGVLWWAGHHRHHHRYSDQAEDVHSPKKGFWWSHMGWIVCPKYSETPVEQIRDFEKYPELRWLDRFHLVPAALLALACYVIGGPSALVIGYFTSTVFLYHGTFTVNSLAHVFGRRRYETTDTSRNSFLIALFTGGEGWHNNHHYYESTANNGFFWWEVDFSYYTLKVLSWFGMVWDLRLPPDYILEGRDARGKRRDLVADYAVPHAPAVDLVPTDVPEEVAVGE